MNAPERISLPDIQSQLDTRNIAIDAVGIKGVRYPVTVLGAAGLAPTIATLSMTVGLSAATKGTHNQRSHVTIEAQMTGDMAIEELVAVAERSASCEVYGLLKRPDEKYVTERAYDNPKFVEDLVRDVAIMLDREPRVAAYMVEAENFESIHNHSAFARILRPSLTGQPMRKESGRERDCHLSPTA